MATGQMITWTNGYRVNGYRTNSYVTQNFTFLDGNKLKIPRQIIEVILYGEMISE